jgi:hypothetical protein
VEGGLAEEGAVRLLFEAVEVTDSASELRRVFDLFFAMAGRKFRLTERKNWRAEPRGRGEETRRAAGGQSSEADRDGNFLSFLSQAKIKAGQRPGLGQAERLVCTFLLNISDGQPPSCRDDNSPQVCEPYSTGDADAVMQTNIRPCARQRQ